MLQLVIHYSHFIFLTSNKNFIEKKQPKYTGGVLRENYTQYLKLVYSHILKPNLEANFGTLNLCFSVKYNPSLIFIYSHFSKSNSEENFLQTIRYNLKASWESQRKE